ncbi:MAG TPA: dihydroorotate dehydrogenase electron transfer subunit [candidate division Zixibacteria bacterium]|nr:dihydroorotate dehydrogenase electron transfer subunit [candidate division Zixibacteria bacterium]
MKKPTCEDSYLLKKRDLKNDYFSLTFQNYPRAGECAPGHFVHVQLPSTDIFFRRPMSVASASAKDDQLEIIFKVFGRGTRLMGKLRESDRVNILGPLGVPFAFPGKDEHLIMIAGGVGFPPLLYLATQLVNAGFDPKKIEFFYGGKSSDDIIEVPRIRDTGVNFHPVTEDGSLGQTGLVTAPAEQFINSHNGDQLRIFGCGPEGMLRATNDLGVRLGIPGQISLEAPMPCGIGICLGCVVPLTKGGHARVCCEGPVFEIGEVVL